MAFRIQDHLQAIVLLLVSCALLGLQKSREPSVIFTCTTFFDFEKQDKWKAFCRAMDSILEVHSPDTLKRVHRWIIVNEYSANPKFVWTNKVKEKYPFIEVIQKTEVDKGQAASMNILLQYIPEYKYWIHWEETWYCRKPCIDRMIDVMKHSTITQLQVTQLKDKPNWLDSEAHPRRLMTTPMGTEYVQIFPSPGTERYVRKSAYEYNTDFVGHWPLYSLLPSINRTSRYRFGGFSQDPVLWPFKFEWDFGRRWLLTGNTKAVLPDGPVIRDNSEHKSTYS